MNHCLHSWNGWIRSAAAAFGLLLPPLASGCFDAEEATMGLRCTKDEHCGGGLQCIAGACGQPQQCDTTPEQCDTSQTSGSISASAEGSGSLSASGGTGGCALPGQSCDGVACCDGRCLDYGDGTLRCASECQIGSDCQDSCCCLKLADEDTRVCVETSYCGQEAACPGSGCASPGAACDSDSDCCGEAVCTLNQGGYHSCFKICSASSDCVSGCCNYYSEISASICESNC